jgi:hypothetical protein
MPNQTTAVLLAALSSCAKTLAQGPACEPQRFFPDFQPESLEFGMGVQISDEHFLVADRFGGAKIYTYQKDPASGRWTLSHTVPGGGVGASLALSGDRFITGSYDVERYGGAIIYEFDGEQWKEIAHLESPDIASLSPWGNGVSIHRDAALLANWGSIVHAFREVEGVWVKVAELRATPAMPGRTDFGNAMDMDDRFFFIGAPGENIAGIQSGAVYVYEWDAEGRPVLFQKLTPEPAPVGPRLGTSIDVDGDTMVVGAREYRIGDQFGLGAAYVYKLRDGRWGLEQTLFAPIMTLGSQFGWDVAIKDGVIVVGAITEGRGTAHVFRADRDGFWRHADRITLDIPGLEYAESVALSSTQVAIGGSEARHMGYDQGVADVYDLDCLLCEPDLDADGALTVFDFLTFLNMFDAGDAQADFDGDGELTIFDFLAFGTAFDAGC